MNCRDVLDVADSFLSEALLTETNHAILRHLEICASCRAEIDARGRVRRALRAAFDRAPALQPAVDFTTRLRGQLRDVEQQRQPRPRAVRHGRWLALAASVLLAAGLVVYLAMNQSLAPVDALARDARGDHWNCALKNRLVRMPVPLEEAAERFDSAYRRLISSPPHDIATPGGTARVVERHACAYGTRRFGHVILNYRGRVVSLLVAADDEPTNAALRGEVPHVHGHPVDGVSVVSVRAPHHAILLVGDLEEQELTQLSKLVSVPLALQLEARATRPDPAPLALWTATATMVRLGSGDGR